MKKLNHKTEKKINNEPPTPGEIEKLILEELKEGIKTIIQAWLLLLIGKIRISFSAIYILFKAKIEPKSFPLSSANFFLLKEVLFSITRVIFSEDISEGKEIKSKGISKFVSDKDIEWINTYLSQTFFSGFKVSRANNYLR